MGIQSFPPSSGVSFPYKQLKLNKVTSPICTSANQPKGVMVDYNSTYYISYSNFSLFKIRKTDGATVSTVSVNGKSIPIIINDIAILLSTSAGIEVVDLITMTKKTFLFPTTSSGAITITSSYNQHLDAKYISGTQYQILIWVQGATASGTIVCTMDTTASNNATMTQVSFKNIGVPENNGITYCAFGIGTDLNYYYGYSDGKFYKTVISTGVATSIAYTNTGRKSIDVNSFKAFQTLEYFLLKTNDAVIEAIKKSNGEVVFLNIEADLFNVSQIPCQKNTEDYCLFSTQRTIYVFKNNLTYYQILKEESNLYKLNASAQTDDGIFSFDFINNKIYLSKGCYFNNQDTLTNASTILPIREYDIV